MKKKILITGGNGMLAYEFIKKYKDVFELKSVDKEDCDITSFGSILQCITAFDPDVIVNCAAYTAVDDAEDIGRLISFEVNTLGVKNLAKAASICDIEFITISTDYVFDGKKNEGYLPSDPCNPISTYGISKYLGEKLAIEENPRTLIVRTSWLYGGEVYGNEKGVYKNFVNTMLRLGEKNQELRVVNDQFGIPTYAGHLSDAIAELIFDFENIIQKFGNILHFSNSSENPVSWYDFAKEIFAIESKKVSVMPCGTDEYPTRAKRPEWSILKNTSDIILPDWKEGLRTYLGRI